MAPPRRRRGARSSQRRVRGASCDGLVGTLAAGDPTQVAPEDGFPDQRDGVDLDDEVEVAPPTTAISVIGSADHAVFELVQALHRTDEDLAGELGASSSSE